MNAKQTKLIEQAATVETDGEGWRKRMERWLDARTKPYFQPHGRATRSDSRKLNKILVKNQGSTPDYHAWINQRDMAILWANHTP